MALTNLWGSVFSRIERVGGQPTTMAKPFRSGLFNRVELNVGKPVETGDVQLEGLRELVVGLLKRSAKI